jgi:hypothetical protein
MINNPIIKNIIFIFIIIFTNVCCIVLMPKLGSCIF